MPKLTGADDFIKWRLHSKVYLPHQDIELIELSDRPNGASAAHCKSWLENNVKAKSAIKPTHSDEQLSQKSTIVEDEYQTAKGLWTALDNVYRMFNMQMVINIKRGLEPMTINEDGEWKKHVERSHHLIGKLFFSRQTTCCRGLNTLPFRFAPIAVAAEASIVSFEKIIALVKAEIFLRKKQDTERSPLPVTATVSHIRNLIEQILTAIRLEKWKRSLFRFAKNQGKLQISAGIATA